MGKRSEKMYKDSPKLERDDESGKVERKKPTSKAAEKEAGTEGENRGGMEDHHGAVLDRHHMYAKHEHEHAMHKDGDKKEMHERHQAEMKAMHKKHEKEGKTGESKIEKTESDKKE